MVVIVFLADILARHEIHKTLGSLRTGNYYEEVQSPLQTETEEPKPEESVLLQALLSTPSSPEHTPTRKNMTLKACNRTFPYPDITITSTDISIELENNASPQTPTGGQHPSNNILTLVPMERALIGTGFGVLGCLLISQSALNYHLRHFNWPFGVRPTQV